VDLEPLAGNAGAQIVRDLVTRHLELTGSRARKWILDNWNGDAIALYQGVPARIQALLGVSRNRQALHPGQRVAVLAHANKCRRAAAEWAAASGQVQHG